MSWGNRVLPLACVALAATALTGCGVQDPTWGPVQHEAADYHPLTEDTFALFTTRATLDYGTAHIEMEVGELSTSMDVSYGEDESDLAMEGTYDDGDVVAEMMMVGGEVYVRDPGYSFWFQFPDRMAEEVLATVDWGNPSQMIGDFEAGLESVEYWESHEVSYGQTHQYRVTMRREYFAEEFGVPLEKVPEVTYQVWLDDKHLIRRMIADVMGDRVDLTMSAYGVPVSIRPPADVRPLPLPSDEA